jgi:hypothetical protein
MSYPAQSRPSAPDLRPSMLLHGTNSVEGASSKRCISDSHVSSGYIQYPLGLHNDELSMRSLRNALKHRGQTQTAKLTRFLELPVFRSTVEDDKIRDYAVEQAQHGRNLLMVVSDVFWDHSGDAICRESEGWTLSGSAQMRI